MKMSSLKYFSTLIFFTAAIPAGWWMWKYYMQSPWTRDGKIRAELVSITPQVYGRMEKLDVEDNQFVHKGSGFSPWMMNLSGLPCSMLRQSWRSLTSLFAPSQKTHIPFLLWMSRDYVTTFGINQQCLQHQAEHDDVSQDNIFHTLLGMLNLETKEYNPELDMIRSCRQGA